MIRIDKGESPQILVLKGLELTESLEAKFDMHMIEYISGELKFEFTTAYRSDEVQECLIKRQYNKCCFSEAKFVGDYPHVEHFRPKGRVDNKDLETVIHPGYFWLAYNWSNLFLCKQLINVSFKRNFFPLEENSAMNYDIEQELPLFIDPAKDDPRNHIYFHQDQLKYKDGRGKATIEYLGLKHPHFASARETKFKLLEGLKSTTELLLNSGIDKSHPTVQKVLNLLREARLPEAEFSSMAIDLLQGWPHVQ